VGKNALKADAIERKESDGTDGNKVKPDPRVKIGRDFITHLDRGRIE